uniref:Major facilitator superfamily (MFS) profile domain-containing protein n=1 Tax=Setaria digitata TaxID=48799 RepID=A0A915PW95_9BILA
MVYIGIVNDSPYKQENPKKQAEANAYVYLLTLVAAMGGLLFGYDTGIVSAIMLYLPYNKYMAGLSTVWQEVIISITSGMAGIGALTAGKSSDKFGRRKVIIAATVFFIAGAIICGAAFDRWTLLIGRILLGIAIGIRFASMVIPVYISEGAPSKVRGKLVTIYQFMVAFGFTVANAAAAWFAHYDPVNIGWRLMFAFAAVPALAQLVGFLFLPETPRYLINHGRDKEAQEVLKKLYGNDKDLIAYEMGEVAREMQRETTLRQDNGDEFVLRRVLRTAHVRKALLLGCALQMFQQLAGINTILYYTSTIIRSAGVHDKITTIWISCAISTVQAVGTILPLNLIERLGRRTLILSSLIGVVITLCMMGSAFILINYDSPEIDPTQAYIGIDINSTAIDKELLQLCARYRNCDDCVNSEYCGYCTLTEASSALSSSFGQCLPINRENVEYSLYGYCEENATNGTDSIFTDNSCKTRFTALPIVIMVLYISVYSFGMGPIPWVFNAEVYPIWARGTCVALSTFTNWSFNLLMSLTYLSLSQAITKYGAFFLYAGVSFVGFIIFYLFAPETRGRRIEEIEQLFMNEDVCKKRISQQNERDETTFSSSRS